MRTLIRILFLVAIGNLVSSTSFAARLPDPVPPKVELERVASPDKSFEIFYLMEPGKIARFGVTSPTGEILWEKNAGFRPIVTFGWSDDNQFVVYVTDCIQPESELPSKKPDTRSYFYILNAADGAIRSEGDLDTVVLDLPNRLPDAVGATHLLEVSIREGKLEARMSHRGTEVEGAKSLEILGIKAP